MKPLAMLLQRRSSTSGVVLATYAGVLLVASLALPWWRMENRAPQYGMRVLVLDVAPTGVSGDIKEIDGLGHYVGMRGVETFAPVERALAPYAVALTAAAALLLPWLKRGALRSLAAMVVVLVPVGFALDLLFWQRHAVTHLDPKASLNLIANRIQSRLVGDYSVAQFRVHATFEEGFWLAVVAGANALGFAIAERKRKLPSEARTRSAVGMLTATTVLLVLLAGPSARAHTIDVGPAHAFATLGSALEASTAGDEIVVHPGLYREHVRIAKSLSLRGEPGAILDGGGTGTIVLVEHDDVLVRGLELRGSGDSLLEEDAAIKLNGAASCQVERNRITDALFGILLRSSPNAQVRANLVVGKDLPIPRRADGIRLQDSHGSLIEDNTVEDSRDLAIWQSNDCVTRRNVVRRCRYGLHYMYCDRNVFEGNEFAGNHTGAAIMYSRHVTLRDNRFTGSRGPSAHGLLIKTADDVIAEHNWFVDNTRGIFLEDTPSSRRADCVIRSNVIGGNDTGVAIEPSVARVVFTENAFIANRAQVEALGWTRAEQNVWSADGRGNYWSDYVGFDADGNGVGDTPYQLEQFFEDLASRYPAVGMLRMAPAAAALECAARAFPIVKPRPTLTDACPLVDPPASLGQPPRSRPRPELVAAGLLLVGAAGLVLWQSRRPLLRGAS